jgi:pimeloyl-ACP methyl ester carboxylesterase
MNNISQLNYQDSGSGPAVVLLHDALMTPDSWRQQVPALLDAEFRVIIPDLSSLNGCEDLTSFSCAIIALLDKLGIGRFAVCGIGMGGSISFALLEQYRHRIAGVCFINTRAGSDDVHEKLKRAQVLSELSSGNDHSAREDLLKMLLGGREKYLTHATRQNIKKTVSDYDTNALIENLKAIQKRDNYMSLLEDIQLPTMSIYGKHDMICHPGYSNIMVSQLPNCLAEIGLEGGHLLQIEQAAAVTSELVDFLTNIVPRRRKGRGSCSLMAAA